MVSYKEAEEAAAEKIMKRKQRLKAAREKREAGHVPTTPLKPIEKKRKPEIDEKAALKHVMRDVERLRKDKRLMLSEETLLYLKAKKAVSSAYFALYSAALKEPKKDLTVSTRGVIENVNDKFLYTYSTV